MSKKYCVTIDTLLVEKFDVEARNKKHASEKAMALSEYNGQGETHIYEIELLSVDE